MGPTARARLTCDESTARRLAAFAGESLNSDNTVCAAFESDGGNWTVELDFRDPPDEAAVRKLIALGGGQAAADALAFDAVEAKDWVAASLAGLKPVAAGRFVVHGAHGRARVPSNAIGIEIEAALAFGTGHHGTTRGCLLALDALMKTKQRGKVAIPPLKGEGRAPKVRGVGSRFTRMHAPHPARGVYHRAALRADPLARRPPPCRGKDKNILDLGTGTGVLAIAAAKALRADVLATDIDPLAIAAARANSRLNRTGAFVKTIRAAGTNAKRIGERAPYHLVFANILAVPLVRMAASIAPLIAKGGHVVLSGLLPAHVNGVLSIYRAQGLILERKLQLEGWVTLLMRRASGVAASKRRF
ncbi:MAG TPA: 50S ribosomal protein L11 methyltransferase [Pseudolabrys sp.]|nr:50S ribosomal protein L11 methyltransferase [Pseudolabrys sp.]